MPAGGPNDHPISDILIYGIETYGRKTDTTFRHLAKLLSDRELEEFWIGSIGWDCSAAKAEKAIKLKLEWASARAKDNQWDIDAEAY